MIKVDSKSIQIEGNVAELTSNIALIAHSLAESFLPKLIDLATMIKNDNLLGLAKSLKEASVNAEKFMEEAGVLDAKDKTNA